MINIVLFQPEIPFNTANIIRTCVGLKAKLHIIEPCGFDLSKEHPDLKRGSTNYLNEVELKKYESFTSFELENNINQNNLFLLTRYGKNIYSDLKNETERDLFFMFGKESSGIEEEILKKYQKNTFRIPMSENMRSLNLSNCVAIVGFEMSRQENFLNLAKEEVLKNDILK